MICYPIIIKKERMSFPGIGHHGDETTGVKEKGKEMALVTGGNEKSCVVRSKLPVVQGKRGE